MTLELYSLRMMMFHMFRMITKKNKIFKTIISLVSVLMMNNFFWVKKSTKMFLHNQTMFVNISVFIWMWVMWVPNHSISMLQNYSTFPVVMIITTAIIVISTLLRTKNYPSRFLSNNFFTTFSTKNSLPFMFPHTFSTTIFSMFRRWFLKNCFAIKTNMFNFSKVFHSNIITYELRSYQYV